MPHPVYIIKIHTYWLRVLYAQNTQIIFPVKAKIDIIYLRRKEE